MILVIGDFIHLQGWEQYNQIDDIMLFLGHQLQFPKTASGYISMYSQYEILIM